MKDTLKTIKLTLLALGMAAFATTAQAAYTDDCITFSSAEAFTLETYYGEKNWDGTLWTSTDQTNWTEWNGAEVSAAKTGGTYNLYVRGNTDNTVITGSSETYRWVLTGSNIACTGNIETLRGATGDQPSPTKMSDYCYCGMFQYCTSLTEAPALPATTLTNDCYYYMFNGCTALTSAPALPATTLAKECYYSMFRGCTALTSAPELPATELAPECYGWMFEYCSALTNAPALPATTLTKHCYGSMFRYCTSLTKAPALPATTLAERCYEWMFYGCTLLEEAPALSAMTLADSCYCAMFADCTSLTVAPELPATTLALGCYDSMFSGCTALEEAPSLPATTLAIHCYGEMFTGCTSLRDVPALPATTLTDACYMSMFYGCTSLEVNTAAPGKEWKIPVASTTASEWGTDMFKGTAGTLQGQPALNTTYYIKSAPEPIDDCITFSSAEAFTLKTGNGTNNWDGTLWTSTDKTAWKEWKGASVSAAKTGSTGPYNLYVRGDTNNTMITGRYYDSQHRWELAGTAGIACTGNIETLRGATGNDPSPKKMARACYKYMFYGCTALTDAPALPATTLASECYQYMFSGCTALTNTPELPATALAERCYESMFEGCTSLTDATELPATTLADRCYSGMFKGCTALEVNAVAPGKEWKIPATSTTATDWGKEMFKDTKGTLQGQPELNTTYFIKSAPLPPPGSRGNPWQIGAGEGDTVEAWTNGTTLVVQGAGKMMDFDAEDSLVPWPVEQIAAVEIAKGVTSIGQNAWLGLADSVSYNNLSATAAKTMGNGFGGTTQYARTAFREFLVNGASISATVALETAKSLTNEWTHVKLEAKDVSVDADGNIVIQHESAPQSQGFYLLQPTE